jgi:hypothetical protein
MSLFSTRLEHLILTEPFLTWEKFNKDPAKLEREINDRIDRALEYGGKLGNLPPGGKDELVYNYVAPRDVPEAEEQLTEEQQLQIMEWDVSPFEKKTATT